MSRFNPDHDVKSILPAAESWAERCLLRDDSVFSNAEHLWTVQHLNEVDVAFVQNVYEGEGNFFDKLQKQLDTAPAACAKLTAEALWLLMLFQSKISPKTKRDNIKLVWSWSGDQLDESHPLLGDSVLGGVGSAGPAFNTFRWRELAYLFRLARAFKSLAPDERRQALSNADQFQGWLASVPETGHRQLAHILKYLLFPDSFERIASGRDKRAIVAAFRGLSEAQVRDLSREAIDDALLEIRQKLEAEKKSTEIDFYSPDLRPRWGEQSGARTWLLSWNPKNWDWKTLSDDREMTASGNAVVHNWRCSSTKPKEGESVYLVRTGVAPKGIVATGLVVRASYEGPHYDSRKAETGENVRYIDVEFTAIRDAAKDPIVPVELLDQRQPDQAWSPQSSGIEIKPAAAALLTQLWNDLPAIQPNSAAVSAPLAQPTRARNLVLFGPPGTGKTFQLLNSYKPEYSEGGNRYEFITFHQSYSYEDFIEGIRPQVGRDGGVAYEIKHGVFRRLCTRAKEDPSRRYAIFIDEINRGNIAKIFGELITLLEPDKRATYAPDGRLVSGMEATLPYSGDRFGVPANVDVFATMNTADRSIALLDVALRRRFEFEEVRPKPGVIRGTGDGTIPDGEDDVIDLRRLLEVINNRIESLLNRDQAIGHSYFVDVRDLESLRKVIYREVIPLLQEYFYENWEQIRLVLADDTVQTEHQLIKATKIPKADLFGVNAPDGDDVIFYSVTPEPQITADALRKIYESMP